MADSLPRPIPPYVDIRRSKRRKRTVSAYRDGERVVVLMPDRLSASEEARWVETMLARLEKQRSRSRVSDEKLLARAHELACRHLPEVPEPASVRWVSNQNRRWGSCTPADRSIRLSTRHPCEQTPPPVPPPAVHARLVGRLRPRPRAGPPRRALSQHGLLEAGPPLPQSRTRRRLPGRHLSRRLPEPRRLLTALATSGLGGCRTSDPWSCLRVSVQFKTHA